jgi:hypothetical protein
MLPNYNVRRFFGFHSTYFTGTVNKVEGGGYLYSMPNDIRPVALKYMPMI